MKFLTFVLALLAGVASAQAADIRGSSKDTPAHVLPSVEAETWSGLYIGAQLGYGHTVLSDDDGRGGLDLSGMFGGLRAGGDIQRGAIVFGLWGEYNWSGQELDISNTVLIEQTSDWSVNARVGVAHNSTLFYAFGGYGQTYFESFDEEADAPLWRAGAGIEHKLQNGLSLGLEYAHTWIDADELLGQDAEDVVDVNDDRVMAVLRYRFGASAVSNAIGN